MLPPAEAEGRLLASVQRLSDLNVISSRGVTSSSFAVYRAVYEYVVQFAREYGAVPSWEDLRLQFELPDLAAGSVEFYADEVLKGGLARQAYQAVTTHFGADSVKLLANPQVAIEAVIGALRQMQPGLIRHEAHVDRDALERLAWLQEREKLAATGKVMGMPTGLSCFDSWQQGWEMGEAIMVMAPKGVGKTWLLMYFGVVSYRAGYRVLFLSPEMSSRECALRFDVLYAYQQGVALSHEALRVGKQEVEIYEGFLRDLSRRDQFMVIDSPGVRGFTMESVLGLVDQHRPDLVLLDGLHLLGGEINQPHWDRIKTAADALKAQAQHYGHTVIWSSQVDREAMRHPTEPASSGASAAYGKAAVEAANRLITLAGYEDDDRRRTFKVPNNRAGREYHVRQYLRFDVDIGRIEQEIAAASEEEPF